VYREYYKPTKKQNKSKNFQNKTGYFYFQLHARETENLEEELWKSCMRRSRINTLGC